MQVSTAEVEQRLELQFGLHAADRGFGVIDQCKQIAEIFSQQGLFTVGQVVRRQLQQMPASQVDIHRI